MGGNASHFFAAGKGGSGMHLKAECRRLIGLIPIGWRVASRRGHLVATALFVMLFGAMLVRVSDVPTEFIVASLVVAAVPGTGVFFTISSAIGGGWRQGWWASIGCTLGVVPHLVMAMLGLSGIMQISATVFQVMRYVGVAYLVAMGVSMIRDRGAMLVGDASEPDSPSAVVIRRGVLLNLLNPKLTLFFFAFLPQFLDRSPRVFDSRLLALAAVFMLATFVVFVAYAYASATLRDRVLAAPRARRWFQRVLGSLLITFGLKLALTD